MTTSRCETAGYWERKCTTISWRTSTSFTADLCSGIEATSLPFRGRISRSYVLCADNSFCLRVAVTVTLSTNNTQGLSRPGLVRSTGSRNWRSRLPRIPPSLTSDVSVQRRRHCMRKSGILSKIRRRTGLYYLTPVSSFCRGTLSLRATLHMFATRRPYKALHGQ